MAEVFPTTAETAAAATRPLPEAVYEEWTIGGERTEILQIRHSKSERSKAVVLMIPGNPGVIDYYENFLKTLHTECNGEISIVGTQHLGHSAAVVHKKNYAVSDQVAHKIALLGEIERRYGKDMPIVVIGHSFGCWVAVQLLNARPDANIVKVVALFPTLHSMATSPQGQIIQYAALPVLRIVPALFISLLRLLIPSPTYFRSVVRFFASNQSPQDLTATVDKLLHFRTVHNTLYLAHHEMTQIVKWKPEDLKPHIDKFTFYYGATDRWVPLFHAQLTKDEFPDADVHVCRDDLPHAFVMGYADVMGRKTAEWIRPAVGL
ncbi:hypothetical protein DFJ77DRAFT_508698 [Powellomyces hirtus]|nr:hypothetical protein DFJ77DRAFT_508698 [Powellomyces hirtus]